MPIFMAFRPPWWIGSNLVDAGSPLLDLGLDPRCDQLTPELDLARVCEGRPEDEGVDGELRRPPGQPLDPVVDGSAQPALVGRRLPAYAAEVEPPPDRGRVASRPARGLVDGLVQAADLLDAGSAQRRQPAVGDTTDEPQHARLVGADPDLDAVSGWRARPIAGRPVMLTLEAHALFACPGPPDQLDRLFQRLYSFTRRAARTAHRLDRVPESPGTKPELETASAEQVQGGGLFGQHWRRPEGQVRNIGEDADLPGLGQKVADQRHGVQEPPLVWMVLDPDEVEAGGVGRRHQRSRFFEVGCDGDHRDAEFERPPVVH